MTVPTAHVRRLLVRLAPKNDLNVVDVSKYIGLRGSAQHCELDSI